MKVLAVFVSLLVCGSALDRATFRTNASAVAQPDSTKVEWVDTTPAKDSETEEQLSKIDPPIPSSGTAPGGLAVIHRGIVNTHTKRRCKDQKIVAEADSYDIHSSTVHDEATAKKLFDDADFDKDGRLKRLELQKAFKTNQPGCDGNNDWPEIQKIFENPGADEGEINGISFKTFFKALNDNEWKIIGSDDYYPPSPQEKVVGEMTRPDSASVFPHMSPSRFGVNGGNGKAYTTNTAKSPLTGMIGF